MTDNQWQEEEEKIKKAFDDIFKQFKMQNSGKKVLSVAFDKEPAIMGRLMQNYFKEKNFDLFQSITVVFSSGANCKARVIQSYEAV